MSFVVFGHDRDIMEWTSRQLGDLYFDPEKSTALGIIHKATLVAGVVYTGMQCRPDGTTYAIEMSIASVDKSWCNRHNLQILFAYPFRQLKLKRVTATCARKNKKVRMFLTRLGFRFEGIGRESWPLGGDSAAYAMLQPECKWLKYGQILPSDSTSA